LQDQSHLDFDPALRKIFDGDRTPNKAEFWEAYGMRARGEHVRGSLMDLLERRSKIVKDDAVFNYLDIPLAEDLVQM
jgi:hypothetical protein